MIYIKPTIKPLNQKLMKLTKYKQYTKKNEKTPDAKNDLL